MVKKLLKHEFIYYIRSLLPVYIVLFGVAAMGRFIATFEADTAGYMILRGSSVFALVTTCIVAMLLSVVFCITRFYKNMFAGEGYLTLTLPVTPMQHLFSKFTVGFLAILTTMIAIVLSICVFTMGDWLVEIWRAAAYLFNALTKEMNAVHIFFYIVEIVILLMLSIVAEILVFYMCICVGQTFRKNRVLASVGIYFALYMIGQTLSTIVTIICTVFYQPLHLDKLLELIRQNPHQSAHVILCVSILISALISLAYFLISRYILTKKLNLE